MAILVNRADAKAVIRSWWKPGAGVIVFDEEQQRWCHGHITKVFGGTKLKVSYVCFCRVQQARAMEDRRETLEEDHDEAEENDIDMDETVNENEEDEVEVSEDDQEDSSDDPFSPDFYEKWIWDTRNVVANRMDEELVRPCRQDIHRVMYQGYGSLFDLEKFEEKWQDF